MERYRVSDDHAVYFMTFSVVQWLPVFVAEGAFRIVTESLNYCHSRKGLRVNAYVIMPTHLHGIFFHQDFDSAALEQSLTDFRKFTGRRLSDDCEKHMPPCFRDVLRQSAGADRERRFWQPTRHPEAIETEAFWRQKIDYLHTNPCRKGLVVRAQYWRFSSAAFWLTDDQWPTDVILSELQW